MNSWVGWVIDRFSPGGRRAEERAADGLSGGSGSGSGSNNSSSRKRPSPNSWLGNEPQAAHLARSDERKARDGASGTVLAPVPHRLGLRPPASRPKKVSKQRPGGLIANASVVERKSRLPKRHSNGHGHGGTTYRPLANEPAPRTPVARRRSSGGAGGAASVGVQVGVGSAGGGGGVGGAARRDVLGMGSGVAGRTAGFGFDRPSFSSFTPTVPQSTPRRLIKANILTARAPSTLDGRRVVFGGAAGYLRGTDSLGTNRGLRSRFRGSSSSSGGRREGGLFAAFSGFGRRGSQRAGVSGSGPRGQGAGMAEVVASADHSSNEAVARRGLNDLRSKARQLYEEKASTLKERNPRGAEMMLKDARHIGNYGREDELEGALQEAAQSAFRVSRILAVHEARLAREAAAAEAEKAKAAAAAAAEALARKEKEEEEARARAMREEEQEKARLAVVAAAAAAGAAAAAAEARAKKLAAQEKPKLKLTPEQKEQVRRAQALDGGRANEGDVIVRAFNDLVTRGSMRTLRPGEWLGDEVINVYMKSLQARNRDAVAAGKQVPRCGIMSSFFYTQLSDNGRGYRYQGVKRFLKKAKIDLFDLDKFLFPVNVNQNHWTLAVINFRLQRLEYFDSLGSPFGDDGFEYMARFVDDESKNKRGGQGMDVSSWPRFNYGNVPRQRNGLDCGVFASMFADRLSKGKALDFSQGDIGFYRQVMTLAILRGERVPTEEEALLEDGGDRVNMNPWWELPQEDGQAQGEEEEEEFEGEESDGQGREEGKVEGGWEAGWLGGGEVQFNGTMVREDYGAAQGGYDGMDVEPCDDTAGGGQHGKEFVEPGSALGENEWECRPAEQRKALSEWTRPRVNGLEGQPPTGPGPTSGSRNGIVIPVGGLGVEPHNGWRMDDS